MPDPSPAPAPRADLLSVLDAVVSFDGKPSGLTGTLAVAVCGPASVRWWSVVLGARPRTAFSDAPPVGAQTVFLLGGTEADRILGAMPLPARPLLDVLGDRSLLERFLARYFGGVSPLGLRCRAETAR